MKFTVVKDDITIYDSYLISKKRFDLCLGEISRYITENSIDCDVFKERSYLSLKLEWSTHNFLYKLNIKPSQTKDVDLNVPQKWYEKVGYSVCGLFGWIFIK